MKLSSLSKEEIIKKYFELEKENERLREEKEYLEKELKKYKNSNTPSSANKHLKVNSEGIKAKKGAKRGAPKGHKGNTLILSEPDKIKEVTTKECPSCNSTDIRPTGYVKIRKIICYQKAKTYIKEYRQYEYVCIPEGKLFLARHKDLPENGKYDKSIESLVNYYKFKARLPYKILVDIMNNIHDVPMTEPTSLAITRRASDKLQPLYETLETDVKNSKIIHGDETSCSVKGDNHWMWVFCNALLSFFKMKKERGGDIVEKTLGKDFKGKLVSDGWATYSTYTNENKIVHQRCLDHLRREVKFECKIKHPDLYKWCCDICSWVKKGKQYKYKKRRLKIHDKCIEHLSMLISHMRAHANLRKLANKIENGKEKWFACIIHPELPMDNNEAERSLRPFVIIRKIIGCIRSDIGKKNYEVMLSLVSTWEKQGKNVFYCLRDAL